MNGSRVFLCYSRSEEKVAGAVTQLLHHAGIDSWSEAEDLGPESGRVAVLSRALERSALVLAISSSGSEGSPWVSQCLGMAITREIPVIDFHLKTGPDATTSDHPRRFERVEADLQPTESDLGHLAVALRRVFDLGHAAHLNERRGPATEGRGPGLDDAAEAEPRRPRGSGIGVGVFLACAMILGCAMILYASGRDLYAPGAISAVAFVASLAMQAYFWRWVRRRADGPDTPPRGSFKVLEAIQEFIADEEPDRAYHA